MKTDSEIAQSVALAPIGQVAEALGIDPAEIEPYGRHMAKISERLIDAERVRRSRLILVTAITPTRAGIGKTTVERIQATARMRGMSLLGRIS